MVLKKKTPEKSIKKRSSSRKKTVAATVTQRDSFPIVGIGASAGGLEALQIFFSNVPVDCGIAFVVVQHLDPHHKSLLASLLKKYTSMETVEITDGITVRKNWIYLAPPENNIAIVNNTLQLLQVENVHGINLPIDIFFQSLADDQHERAIGIVLSGTGSDGTAGIKAIKTAGGMAMVQQVLLFFQELTY